MGHVTLTTPLLWVYRLGFDTFHLCAKFDDSSESHSTDMTRAPKFKVGYVTLTTPLLRVICHQYADT